MDDRHVCNELFLRAVANQYALDFKKLKMGVLDAFTREEQDDIDPGSDFLHSTEHFDCFVKEHKIKEVNVGIVVLYLKGVKLAVSNQEILNHSYELQDDLEYEHTKKKWTRLVLSATIIMSWGLSLFLTDNSFL